MAEEKTEVKKLILDGKEVTSEQLREAQKNPAVRIIEDKTTGEYRTLQKLKE